MLAAATALGAVGCTSSHQPTQSRLMRMVTHPGSPNEQSLAAVVRTWGMCLAERGVLQQRVTGRGSRTAVVITFGDQYAFRVTHPGTPAAHAAPTNAAAADLIASTVRSDPTCVQRTRAFFANQTDVG